MKVQRAKPKAAPPPAAPLAPPTAEPPDRRPIAVARPPDLSVLRKSIATSVTGFAKACAVFESCTPELKRLLSLECDVIYECRVCRNLFRSLANFISHKRVYCCENFDRCAHPHFGDDGHAKDDIAIILQNETEYQNFLKNKNRFNATDTAAAAVIAQEKKATVTKDLTSIIDNLLQRKEVSKSKNSRTLAEIQPTQETTEAVYLDVLSNRSAAHESTRNQVAELEMMINSKEGILGPDGKLVSCRSFSDSSDRPQLQPDEKNEKKSKSEMFCGICKMEFNTIKSLKFHVQQKHSNNRVVYPCIECEDTFSNSWSVLRHLIKVHRKSSTNIKKLRDTIHKKAYKLDISTVNTEAQKEKNIPSEVLTEQEKVDQENQAWMDNLEADGDIPRCGGCGKCFERRAALSAHRQTCKLRKSAQNKIHSNSQKKVTVKNKEQEEASPSEPAAKMIKVDKPPEKRIEIKIRKDYNKSGPLITTDNSSWIGDDDDVDRNIESIVQNVPFDIGEDDSNALVVNNSFQSEKPNFDEIILKDYDDANVDMHSENMSSVTNDDDQLNNGEKTDSEEIDTGCQGETNFSTDSNGQKSSISNVALENDIEISTDILMEKMNFSDVGNYNDSLPICKTQNQMGPEDFPELHKCTYCSSMFIEKEKLDRHITRHMIWMKYECKVCGVKSCNRVQYERHMQNQHGSIRESETSADPETTNVEATDEAPLIIDDSKLNTKKRKRRERKNIEKKKSIVKRKRKLSSKMSYLLQENFFVEPEAESSRLDSTAQVNEVSSITNVDTVSSEPRKLNARQPPKEAKIKRRRHNQLLASSESFPVQRPVRNRVKIVDKDFEYDSPYFSQTRNEIRDSSISSDHPIETPSKAQSKRKFLQSSDAEEPAKVCQDSTSAQCDSSVPKANSQPGALQTVSLRASSLGKAHMKIKRAPVAKRNYVPFDQAKTKSYEIAKTTAAVPTTTTTPDDAPPPCTPSTTSKRSYSDVKRRRVGKSSETSKKSEKSRKMNSSKMQKRKSPPDPPVPKLPTAPKAVANLDRQAIGACPFYSKEITVIPKSTEDLNKTNSMPPDTLSIVPSGEKASTSFVNISLKQLKNLQKDDDDDFDPEKSDIFEDVSQLLSLECNDQIKISKVSSRNKADDVASVRKVVNAGFQNSVPKQYKNVNASRLKPLQNANSVEDSPVGDGEELLPMCLESFEDV